MNRYMNHHTYRHQILTLRKFSILLIIALLLTSLPASTMLVHAQEEGELETEETPPVVIEDPNIILPESLEQDGDGPWSLPSEEIAEETIEAAAANVYDDTIFTVRDRIGVGTDAPVHRMVVTGNANGVNRFLIRNNSSGERASSDVYLTTGSAAGLMIQKFGRGFSRFSWSGRSLANWARLRTDTGVNGLIVAAGRGPLVFGANDIERVRIASNGNVGIGTSSPNFPLSLGRSLGRTKLALYETSASNSYGLGVVSGAFRLHINGPGARFAFFNSDEANAAEIFTVNGNGNVGIGTRYPGRKLDVVGTTRTQILQITGGSDLAEPFNVTNSTEGEPVEIEPGMVVAIDPENPGNLRLAEGAYNRTVAGVISGAGGINPGLVLQQEGTIATGEHPVALSGRVYVWADASNGSIQPGDLLTTSANRGHAMKVTDHEQAQGAILGKAMSALDEETGLVLVLVSLQ